MSKELYRTKSFDYSMYALNALMQTAEIARHHGVDLYHYELSDGRGLEKALDTHAPYLLNPSSWPEDQITPYAEENDALMELAYSEYQKQAYLDVINDRGRPMYTSRIMGWTTLTHGNLFALGGGDTTPPVVSVTAPANGATVSGSVTISASASDPGGSGVAGVRFKLNGNNLGSEDVSSPYSITWNTNTVVDGNYSISAEARDLAGNVETSTSISVTVDNPADTIAPTVPTNLVAGGVTAFTVDLDWTASTDNVFVSGYKIYFNGSNPVTVSSNSVTLTNLPSDSTFTLTVSAFDPSGNESAQSSGVQVTTPQVNNPEIAGVTASDDDGNLPENTLDGDLGTRWSANGDEQWIRYELDADYIIESVALAFHNGASRSSYFDLQVSSNGTNWTTVLASGESSGTTTQLESFDFPDTQGRYVRYLGHGNSTNEWNSITEAVLNLSSVAQDTTPPSVPTGLAASNITLNSVDLDWNASSDPGPGASGVAGYKIYTGGANPVDVGNFTSITVNSLVPDTAYTFSVSAYDTASNESSQSSGLNVTTDEDQSAPSVPTGLAAGTVTATTVDLSWNASTDNVGVAGYHIRVNGGSPIDVGNVTSYTVSSLTPSTSYSFTVSAYDAAGNESSPGSAVNATTASSSGPLISEDFSSGAGNFAVVSGGSWNVSSGRYVLSSPATSGTNGILGNISLHNTSVSGDFALTSVVRITANSAWDDAAVIFGYQDASNYYYVSLNESNNETTKGIFKVVSGTATELADITTTIAAGTDYTVEVERSGVSIIARINSTQVATASDSTFTDGKVGFGSFNDGAQFDDLVVTGSGGGDIEAPSVPTGLASGTVTTTTVDLSWSASSDDVGVVGYKVYTNGANPQTVVGGTSTTIGSLTQNTAYAFTVTAYDAAGNESSASSGVNVTTADGEAPSVPTGLASGTVTTTTVDLSWSASSDNVGVVGYKVYTNGANPQTVVVGTSTTIGSLTESTAYTFTVTAYDAAGNESSASSGINVTTDGPLILEDFSSGAGNFTVVSGGSWNVSSGRYVLSSPATSGTNGILGNISLHNTSISGDFVLTVVLNITANSAWDDAAVIFGYQDANNYYYVSLNEGNNETTKGIFKVVSGTPTQLADITTTITTGTDYTVEVERSGSSIIASVDSTQVTTTSDSTFSSGKVGLGSFNDGAQFDDLEVR